MELGRAGPERREQLKSRSNSLFSFYQSKHGVVAAFSASGNQPRSVCPAESGKEGENRSGAQRGGAVAGGAGPAAQRQEIKRPQPFSEGSREAELGTGQLEVHQAWACSQKIKGSVLSTRHRIQRRETRPMPAAL